MNYPVSLIIEELLFYHSAEKLAQELGVDVETIAQMSFCEDRVNGKLLDIWNAHVSSNLTEITIADLVDGIKNGSSYLVDTPDGVVPVVTLFEKNERELINVVTSGHSITCSEDHLLETTAGWKFAKEVKFGTPLITRNGLEEVVSIKKLPSEKVWDFEVAHENHRYWGGTGISSHNSGKSFILCNALKQAQEEGAFILVLDSEHALDTNYLENIGVDLSEDRFMYAGVTTFNQVVEVVSEFIKSYIGAYGKDNKDAPRVIIALDSIDMLITDSENANFEGGEQKGDQGQRAKQQKHMLRTIVSRIKRLQMSFILTHQVYPNADIKNGLGKWIVNNALRYSCSQIAIVEALKLKDGIDVVGVRMRVETYKSRFSQPGVKVELEVPYATGINKYSGFLDKMEEDGIINVAGAWKNIKLPGYEQPIKFQTKHLDDELFKKIMSHPDVVKTEQHVQAEMVKMIDDHEVDPETGEIVGM